MFGTVKLVRNADKSKFTYNGRRIAFDGEGSWSFGNDFDVIFGADNSSSSHTDNKKKNFLVLGNGPIQGINDITGSTGKKISINFSKANTKFCSSLHYNVDESYFYVNKIDNIPKDNIRWYNSCLGSISKDFTKDEQSEN